MSSSDLPLLNALLNGTAAVLLVVGWRLVRVGRREAHRRVMIAATTVSALFLVSYLVYHALHGSTRFGGEGWVRPLYFTILLTHTVLAAAQLPLIVVSLTLAARGHFVSHRRWARITLPVWLYVSITGVVIYLMLYRLFPPHVG